MPDAGLAPQWLAGSRHDRSVRPRLFGVVLDPRLELPLGVLSLAGLYYGTAQLGHVLHFAGAVAAIVWLPVGIAIAFLYLAGLRFWPGVVLGDLLTNSYASLPAGSALGQAFGNLLEVVLAVYLMRRLITDGRPLGSISGLAKMLVAITAGTAVSATIGLLSLRLGNVVTTPALPRLWRTWWLGDTTGALLLVPLALAWFPPPPREWLRAHALEGALVLVAIAAISELTLRNNHPLAYVVFPALIWAALRLGTRGATAAVAAAAGFAMWATTHYVGPFVYHSITHSILATQLYIAVASLACLTLAVVASERENFAAQLQASRVRLVQAADGERQRLERNLHDGAQQRLTALAVRLGISAEESDANPTGATAALNRAQEELLVSIDELRELAHGIHPSVLTRFGLKTAAAEIAARSAVPTELTGLPSVRLDDTAEATSYYVLAEAITNAQKHARSSSIRVWARLTPGRLYIEVADDGIGGAVESDGLGLQGLRDRVEAIGGTLEVESPVGRGTRVRAAVPASLVRTRITPS